MTMQEPEFRFTKLQAITIYTRSSVWRQRVSVVGTGNTPPSQIQDMDNRSYPSHCDRNNFHVEADISEYSDTDSEDEEFSSEEETWLTDE